MIVTSSRLRVAFASAVLAIGMGSTASAATLDLSYFDRSESAAAQAALAAFQAGDASAIGPDKQMASVRTETFGGHQAWNGTAGDSDPTGTNVGDFTTLGGTATGYAKVNGGTALQVRNDDPWIWGRYNTSGGDGNWLDSNGTLGMRWDVAGQGKFNALAFLLTDVADVGAIFSIKVGDTLFSQVIGGTGRMANGSIQLVRILLPEAVDGLVVELFNNRTNDGFGIDGATVARIAPVPVPPAALLLISGAAALVGLRRRSAPRWRRNAPLRLAQRAPAGSQWTSGAPCAPDFFAPRCRLN